jgi:hypothetical protein
LLLDSRGGTKGNALQVGLKRRLSEIGSPRLFRGVIWHGIATPVLSDSYEAGRPLFAHNVKHKMWQLAIIIQFKRATILLQFFNRTEMCSTREYAVAINFLSRQLPFA